MKIWLLLTFFFSTFTLAQPPAVTKIKETVLPNGLLVHEYRLKNGLQLLFVPDRSAPVFTYQVWFKVGSVAEKVDPKLQKTGLAHLFEHMMFRGTPKFPDGAFDQTLSAAGGEGMNATTSWDRTNYFESLPKDKLELAFAIESDRMVNLALDEKLFKTELGAVFGELKMRKDKPGTVSFAEIMNLSFEQHPYKWDVIGTTEELNSFTVADAQYFYKTYYAPNNATIILIGDFTIPTALKLAEKYYAKIPSQEIPSHPVRMDPPQKKARERRVPHPLATTKILTLGFVTPAINHEDIPAIETLVALLSYGEGSLLQQELVEKGLASSASASSNTQRYPCPTIIQVHIPQEAKESVVMDAIHKILAKIEAGEITAKELERAKNQYLLAIYGMLLQPDEIGRYLGESLVSADNYMRGFEVLEKIKSTTVGDVQRVTKQYFQKNQENLVILEKGK